MKHAYLFTDTAYKMLYQAHILDIMYRYDVRRYKIYSKPKHGFK